MLQVERGLVRRMGEREQFQTRLDEATAEQVERFMEERDLTRSAALRLLVEEGLAKVSGDAVSTVELAERLDEVESEVSLVNRNVTAVYNQLQELSE